MYNRLVGEIVYRVQRLYRNITRLWFVYHIRPEKDEFFAITMMRMVLPLSEFRHTDLLRVTRYVRRYNESDHINQYPIPTERELWSILRMRDVLSKYYGTESIIRYVDRYLDKLLELSP